MRERNPMKRTKKPSKQLKLTAQTVRQLSTTTLDDVRGGCGGGNYTGACAKQSNNCLPNQPSV